MTRGLAFLDDAARLGEVPSGFDVVALDPFVSFAEPQAIPLDVHLGDLELEALGEQTYERVEALVASLDAAIGHAPATAHWRFQQLKALYDGALAYALGASRVAEAAGAGEALVLARAGSLAADAVPEGLRAAGLRVETRLAVAPAGPAPRAAPFAQLRTRTRWGLSRRRPRILCLDERYNLSSISAELRACGAEVLLWVPPHGRLRRLPRFDPGPLAPLLQLAGVDLMPVLGPRMSRLAADELPRDEAVSRASGRMLRAHRPDLLVGSIFAAPAVKAAATAARRAGVLSVVIRHGEMGIRALPVMRLNDLDVVDHALCWGEWEARFVERYSPRPVATSVVGSPMVEEGRRRALSRAEARRRAGVGGGERVVLLAPTALSGDDWYIGHRLPFDLSYVRHQVSLVEQLLSVPGWRVLVKEHPSGPRPLEAWAAATGAPLGYVRDGFDEVVNLADVLVLDFPSTTLVQALGGSSRLVVVRHPVTAYEPGVLEHLERHGDRVVEPDRLAAALREEPGGEVVHPREELEPLAASGPGTAAERAAAVLLELAGG